MGRLFSQSWLVFHFSFLFFFSSTSFSAWGDPVTRQASDEVIPVLIHAQSLRYDEASKQVVAKGQVEVKFQQVTLSAEALVLDTKTNVARATGNVKVVRGKNIFLGEEITLTANDETFSLTRFSTQFTHPLIHGDVFVKVETLQDFGTYQQGREAHFTTCDYESPHYHLAAKLFAYYPGDRIECKEVTFYLGNVPILYLPFYTFSLQKRRISLLMPTYGRNAVEGQFLRNRVSYTLDEKNYGEVPIDLLERKGIGYGVKRHYRGEGRVGDVTLYHIDERDTALSSWILDWKHELDLASDRKINVELSDHRIYQVPFGRRDRTTLLAAFSKTQTAEQLGVDVSGEENRLTLRKEAALHLKLTRPGKISTLSEFRTYLSRFDGTSPWRRTDIAWQHEQPWGGEGWMVSWKLDYNRFGTREAVADDEKLYPEIGVKHFGELWDGHDYTLQIKNSWYVDPDGDAFQGDNNLAFLESQPEVNLTFTPWLTSHRAWWLDGYLITPELGWGTFRESRLVPATGRNRVFLGDRYRGGLGVKRTLLVGNSAEGKAQLDTGFQVEQRLYGAGDAQFTIIKTVGTKLARGFFENEVTFLHKFSDGNTPFFFDGLNAEDQYIRDTQLFKFWEKASLKFEGGYNILRERYYDLLGYLDLTPAPTWKFGFRSGYDIENQRYKDLYSTLTAQPEEKMTVAGTAQYDLNRGMYRAATSDVSMEFGDHWETHTKLRISHYFDFTTQNFRLRDCAVEKDLHDWDLSLIYSELMQQFRFTIAFKAFPQQPLGFTSGGGVVEFDGLNPEAFNW